MNKSKTSVFFTALLAIMILLGMNTVAYALSWQTAPIMGYSASSVTGDLVVITGPTPIDANGDYYYDVDNNLVLGPTIPHYNLAGDPLEGVGDPSLTELYFDPYEYNASGDYWYDPDTTIYAGSGVYLTPNTEYTYRQNYTP